HEDSRRILKKNCSLHRPFPNKSLLLAACAACIGGTFQYGYNISIINAPTKSVQNFINQTWLERFKSDIPEQALTLLWSTIVSIFTLGGFIGASVGGTMAIKWGRKGALLINNVFAIVAALLMGLSYPTGLFELLIIGRLFTGINAGKSFTNTLTGIGICVQPLYLGEIAPTALRGAMAMGTSIFITGGILTGQVIGLNELLGKEEYWPLLLSTTCIPAVMQLLSLPWFPESPRFLLIDKGDNEGCNNALKQLHGEESCDSEREDMERERIIAAGVQAKKPWELFSDRSLSWQLLTILLLNSAQQLNGINAIYFYANYVFQQSGIPDDKIPYAAVGTGACECITALTCVSISPYFEVLGRKVLIIGGYTLMSICCILFTLSLTFQDISPIVPYLSMACVFAFILSFGLGPGGVTNILNTELFTQTARPAAYMIAGSVNWFSFFFIGMLFPFIVVSYCFLVFLVVCCLVVIYIILVVPETKNKTFLEIHNEFQSRGKRKASSADGPRATLLSTPL
uniref:Solute carrier family 2, facilitated glucose transporter member 5 n=1 Tax=Myripristis murdjan TaxID=586833 RepID=A0A667YR18_9TELE